MRQPAARLRKWLRGTTRATARLWQRVRAGCARQQLRAWTLLRRRRRPAAPAPAAAVPLSVSASATPRWRIFPLPPEHVQPSGVGTAAAGRRAVVPLPRALAAEPRMQVPVDARAHAPYNNPLRGTHAPTLLDARLGFFARRWAEAPRDGRVLFVVLAWHIGGPDGASAQLEVPGVFRSRDDALAAARDAAAPHDDTQLPEYDSDYGEDDAAYGRPPLRLRALQHRHGTLLSVHHPPVHDDDPDTYQPMSNGRYDVVPIACDPPLGPPFSAAAPTASAAAACAGGFQALMRTFLLCCARLARTRGMPPLSPVLMCRIIDAVARCPHHRPRVHVALSCRLYSGTADVMAHFAVPAALPRAAAAAQAFVDVWAATPDHALALSYGDGAGGEWEEVFPPEQACVTYDARYRVPRRATHAAPCRGHAPESVLADLVDAESARVAFGKVTSRHRYIHSVVPPAMALLELPVDARVGVERVARCDAAAAGRAAAAQPPQRVVRRADAGRCFRTWDGERVAPLCPLYDLLSPAMAVTCEERVCDACGISCEAEPIRDGSVCLVCCLHCRAAQPPPGTARGWRPCFGRGATLVAYESPCPVLGCGNMRNVDFPATAAAAKADQLPKVCDMCDRAQKEQQWYPGSKSVPAWERGYLGPSTMDLAAAPTAPRAERPPGWQPPPVAPPTRRFVPADNRTPCAPGVRPGWTLESSTMFASGMLNSHWYGPCHTCGDQMHAFDVPMVTDAPPQCELCEPPNAALLHSDDYDYGYVSEGDAVDYETGEWVGWDGPQDPADGRYTSDDDG
jgi:hypothetical protein